MFEEEIADYTGAPYAVSVDSCTNALFLVCKYLQVKEVTIPSQTYLSVPMSILHAGGNVVFDTRPETNHWKGIYKFEPYPIYDAAKRLTSNMYIKGSFMCLSFHIKKQLGIGKGGMILTDDKHANDWLRKVRFAGRPGPFYNQMNDVDVLGYHMQMIPEQASRGIEAFYGLQHPCDDKCISETYMDVSGFSVFSDYIL